MCGAIGNPSTSVEPYTIDICGYFPSINDLNVQLLMQTIGTYYTNHRISITTIRKSNKRKKQTIFSFNLFLLFVFK